jgi:hypothetical protein
MGGLRTWGLGGKGHGFGPRLEKRPRHITVELCIRNSLPTRPGSGPSVKRVYVSLLLPSQTLWGPSALRGRLSTHGGCTQAHREEALQGLLYGHSWTVQLAEGFAGTFAFSALVLFEAGSRIADLDMIPLLMLPN